MSPEVKSQKRAYDSSRRRLQAIETRRQIVDAASDLFLARGYVGTTIEAIARQAGVSNETIYGAFGNKLAILLRVIDVNLAGDHEDLPVLARDAPQRIRSEPDQRRQIDMFAHDVAQRLERVAPLDDVLRTAAATEPQIADFRRKMQLEQRLHAMSYFVRALASRGPLRPGLSEQEAIDIVWTLASPEVHRLFTVDRRWPLDYYADWLADTLSATLLPIEAQDPGPRD